MSNLTDFLGKSESLGSMVTDIRAMPSYWVDHSDCRIRSDSTQERSLSETLAYSALSNAGSFLNESLTAGTYYTLCDITGGGGKLFHIIAPKEDTTSTTISFRINIDGKEVIINKLQTETPTRLIIGTVMSGVTFTTDKPATSITSSEYCGLVGVYDNRCYAYGSDILYGKSYLLHPTEVMGHNLTHLRFEKNLKVEVSVDKSITTDLNRRTGVVYSLD